jgi:hypothetical protein
MMAKCINCETETEGTCWVDCGMSICGEPLCDNCKHVDEHIGSLRSWRHDFKVKVIEPEEAE